jgi:DNA ligase (NAD+)
MTKLEQMKEMNERLREASRVYYQGEDEIMTNYEYDKLYDELVELEKETGIILPNSVTQHVGYEVVSSLPKEKHAEKALSLDKTKDMQTLADWLGNNEGIMSWKEDGLTVVVTYKDGKMLKALTRGNGEIGEIITHNAKFFQGLPKSIPYKGEMVIREALISYKEFERINSKITDADKKYKNPRNLASGTVRQLDSKVVAERTVNVKVFELVSCEKDFTEGGTKKDTFSARFDWLSSMGFDVVEHVVVNKDKVIDTIKDFESKIASNEYPSDGLVLMINDVIYGKSLGTTGKYPRCGMAFKWKDETAETIVRNIEWSASRTGLINPVAIFDPIELEGTTVQRATVHNVSILKELKLSVGSTITVYKANMIIPTIDANINPVGKVIIPDKCPVCGTKTIINVSTNEKTKTETLVCPNPDCIAKNIKRFTHFVSREAMNIDGLSEATIEKFIDAGFIKSFVDIYHIDKYKDEITTMEGFGEKSYNNLIKSLEKSKNVRLSNFLVALGIPNVGKDASKKIEKICKGSFEKFKTLVDSKYDFTEIDGVGKIINDSIYDFDFNTVEDLANLLTFEEIKDEVKKENDITGKTFVITGSVEHFSNRNAIKDFIESNGGKVAGSVSSKTDYLVNNDITSNSGKNKKAKELGITIISEETLLEMAK